MRNINGGLASQSPLVALNELQYICETVLGEEEPPVSLLQISGGQTRRGCEVTLGHAHVPTLLSYVPRGSGEAFGIYTVFSAFCHSSQQRRAFLMLPPNSPVLQQLDRLDRSSPEFQDQLYTILRGEEYSQCARDLQGDDLVWIVDYLDKVCHCVALPPLHSSRRRLLMVSIPRLPLPESASVSSEAYAAQGGYSQHRAFFRLIFLILVPSRSLREVMVIGTRELSVVRGFALNAFGFIRIHKRIPMFVIGCRLLCPL